jgi:hypothetical protein
MMTGAWGLEIDKGRLALCQVRRGAHRFEVRRGAAVPLPPDLVTPSLSEPNVTDGDAFTAELRTLMQKASCKGGAVAVAVPDLSCRIGWQDFEEVKGTPAETIELVRWRLKERLPFPAQEARIDCQPLPSQGNGTRLLYLAAREAVLTQYETLLLTVGLEPIQVVSRGVALHRLQRVAGNGGKHLLIAPGPSSLVLIYADQGLPRLWRVLPGDDPGASSLHHAQGGETSAGSVEPQRGTAEDRIARVERIQRELVASLRYLGEETEAGSPEGLVLMGGGDAAVADSLAKACGLPVRAVPEPRHGFPPELLVPVGAALLRPAERRRWISA